ncbi:MAG: hypothetical protein Q7U76_12765 [Nitrospirota bacterium]|nr:hypothetical protein [Nitrospirota bacterium]
MTEAEILELIKARYAPESYAVLPQVRNGTGFTRSARTADAMVMGLWPSRGLELEGFEIKTSRADWLREMKAPQKAEDIFAYCDRWWVAVADRDIVKEGELPKTWGLMVTGARGLLVKVAAPKLEAKPMDRLMLAAMLRKVQAYSTDNAIIEKAKDAADKMGYERGCKTAEGVQKNIEALETMIRTFERASGVSIRRAWDIEEIGKAVQMVRNGALVNGRETLRHLAESSKRLSVEAERELAIIDALNLASHPPACPEGKEADAHDRSPC